MQPFDRGLNVAILHLTGKLLPCGFDLTQDAPSTFPTLIAHVEQTRRIAVYPGGSENTIYGDAEVNYSFRAWHDWCHWRGKHDFSVAGEAAVWRMQCDHLITLYDDAETTRRWCAILFAEVVGQRLYYEEHREYVSDQRRFVADHLRGQPLLLRAAENQSSFNANDNTR